MNKIKAAIAVLAIVLTAGVSYATQNHARFVFCYPPNSSTQTELTCTNPETTICCYTGANNTGTPIFKENP